MLPYRWTLHGFFALPATQASKWPLFLYLMQEVSLPVHVFLHLFLSATQVNPRHRPGIEDVLESSFLKGGVTTSITRTIGNFHEKMVVVEGKVGAVP